METKVVLHWSIDGVGDNTAKKTLPTGTELTMVKGSVIKAGAHQFFTANTYLDPDKSKITIASETLALTVAEAAALVIALTAEGYTL